MTNINHIYNCAANTLCQLHNAAKDNCQLIGAGYTSNLDKITNNSLHTINELLKKYTCTQNRKPGSALSGPVDFLEAVLYYASRGLGAEFSITSELSHFLATNFVCHDGIGGTAAQSAMAIGTLGYPVILHQTDSSVELVRQLQQANLYLVDNGEIIHCTKHSGTTSPMPHYIIQLQKGSHLYANGRDILIPESNRLIFNFDSINPVLKLNSDYLNFIEHNAHRFCSHIISGFNVISDDSVLEQRIGMIIDHLKKTRLANPEIIFYFEDAFYYSMQKKVELYHKLIPYVDILSLNEEELVQLAELSSFSIEADSPLNIVRAVEHLVSCFGPRMGIVLHTKNYSMYLGRKTKADMQKGLAAGNLVAAAKALTGQYGTVQTIMECLNMPLSQYGMLFCKELQNIPLNYQINIVPTKYIEAPQFTIGLGDSFIGGIQTCFL